MKKVLSFVLCILLLVPAFLKPNSVKAYPADSFLERESQATDAMILYVDYFDNKTVVQHPSVLVIT